MGQAGSLAKQLSKKERQAKAKEDKAKAKVAADASGGRILPSDKNPLRVSQHPIQNQPLSSGKSRPPPICLTNVWVGLLCMCTHTGTFYCCPSVG